MIKSPEEQQKLCPFEGVDSRRILWKMLSTRANSRSRSRSRNLSKKIQSQLDNYGFLGFANENNNMSENTILPVKPAKRDIGKYRSNRPKKLSGVPSKALVKQTYTPKKGKKAKTTNKPISISIKKRCLNSKKSSFNSKISFKSKTDKKVKCNKVAKQSKPCLTKNVFKDIQIKKKSFRVIKESIYKENEKLKSWFTRRRSEINKDFAFQIKKKTLEKQG